MENFRLSIEKSEEMYFGCLVDQNDRLVASSFGSNSRILERHLVEYSTKTIGKSPTRSNHRLTQEMIKRFDGTKNLNQVTDEVISFAKEHGVDEIQMLDEVLPI